MKSLHPIEHHRQNCRDVRAEMSDHIDGEFEGDRKAFERHIHWCPNCWRILRNLRLTVTGLRRLRDRASMDS